MGKGISAVFKKTFVFYGLRNRFAKTTFRYLKNHKETVKEAAYNLYNLIKNKDLYVLRTKSGIFTHQHLVAQRIRYKKRSPLSIKTT